MRGLYTMDFRPPQAPQDAFSSIGTAVSSSGARKPASARRRGGIRHVLTPISILDGPMAPMGVNRNRTWHDDFWPVASQRERTSNESVTELATIFIALVTTFGVAEPTEPATGPPAAAAAPTSRS
jgi:hypothetical protein